jgi:tRNA threonylcarbamoyl adenosine modification protein (Sua5/YciO/YrdC/YwlC family)
MEEAAAVLRADGVVVLPTDTVYGVAVRGARPAAAGVLAAVKARPAQQAVALLVGSVGQAAEVALLDERARALTDALWPGPLTLVVPRVSSNDWDLGGTLATVGVRWPDLAFVSGLALATGPLAVTSANPHGAETASSARAAASSLGAEVDLIVDGGRCDAEPSTVLGLVEEEAQVLRAGAMPSNRIRAVLGDG